MLFVSSNCKVIYNFQKLALPYKLNIFFSISGLDKINEATTLNSETSMSPFEVAHKKVKVSFLTGPVLTQTAVAISSCLEF